MADITSSDFQQLIESQKETSRLIEMNTRQLMTSEERLEDDRKKEEERIRRENDNDSDDTEDDDKEESRDKKILGFLKNSAGFLSGIAKKGQEKVQSGLKGFAKFAFGALALAAIAFLNSPMFDKTVKLLKKMIPLLADLYDKYLHPIFLFLKGKFITAFEDIGLFLDGEITAFELLWNNKLVVAGLIGAFAPGIFLAPLKLAGSLALKGLTAGATKTAISSFLSSSGIGAAIGPMAILTGVLLAVKDGMAGIDMAEELGVSKFSGFVGGLLGGMDSGISGMFNNMGKFALIGAGIGSIIPVVGTIIGGAIGALIGAVLGFFGGERIAKAVQEIQDAIFAFFKRIVLKSKNFFGMEMTDAEKADLEAIKAREDAEAAELKASREEQTRLKTKIIRIGNIEKAKIDSARVMEAREERLQAALERAEERGNKQFIAKAKKELEKFEVGKVAEAERLKLLDEEKKQLQADVMQINNNKVSRKNIPSLEEVPNLKTGGVSESVRLKVSQEKAKKDAAALKKQPAEQNQGGTNVAITKQESSDKSVNTSLVATAAPLVPDGSIGKLGAVDG